MKKLIFVLYIAILTLVFSCSPKIKSPVSEETMTSIEQTNAIYDWRKTLKETDECSSTGGLHWLAETFLDKNWFDCCIQHDFDYREGSKYGISKIQADYELWACVKSSGHEYVANIIYTSVDLFGKSSYRQH